MLGLSDYRDSNQYRDSLGVFTIVMVDCQMTKPRKFCTSKISQYMLVHIVLEKSKFKFQLVL